MTAERKIIHLVVGARADHYIYDYRSWSDSTMC